MPEQDQLIWDNHDDDGSGEPAALPHAAHSLTASATSTPSCLSTTGVTARSSTTSRTLWPRYDPGLPRCHGQRTRLERCFESQAATCRFLPTISRAIGSSVRRAMVQCRIRSDSSSCPYFLDWRSSSAPKKAEAAFKMSFARFSSLFSSQELSSGHAHQSTDPVSGRIGLSPIHPVTQSLMIDPKLRRNRLDRFPLRRILMLMLEHHPDRTLTHLSRIPANTLLLLL